MRKFPATEEELLELCNKLNITQHSSATSSGIDRSILQARVLAILAERRNSSLWIIALISSIASVVSAITAIIVVLTK